MPLKVHTKKYKSMCLCVCLCVFLCFCVQCMVGVDGQDKTKSCRESACEVKPAFLGPGRVFLPEKSLCHNSEDEEDAMCKDTV